MGNVLYDSNRNWKGLHMIYHSTQPNDCLWCLTLSEKKEEKKNKNAPEYKVQFLPIFSGRKKEEEKENNLPEYKVPPYF